MYSYNKTLDSPYDPRKVAIHSILPPEVKIISTPGQNFKNTVSFDCMVHFIEENIVTNVDSNCGTTFYPEAPKKSDRSTENGKGFPDPVKT